MGRVRHAVVGVKQAVAEDRVGLVAAGVAFYALLSLFPAMAAGVSIFGLVADPVRIQQQVEGLSLLPPEIRELLATQLERIASRPGTTLGLALVVGVLLALWGATRGAKALIQALDIAHGVREDRGFVRLTLLALAITFGGIVLGLAAVVAVGAVPVLFRTLGDDAAVRYLVTIGTWVVLALCAAAGLSLLYRYGPAQEAGRSRGWSRGALVAAPLWIAASLLFSLYVSRFGNYDETYGSLGAVVILLLWLWVSAYVVVLGAELDVEIERARRSPADSGRGAAAYGGPGTARAH